MSSPLALDPEAVRLASQLVFSESNGGPFLVLSESALGGWHGVHDASGTVIFGAQPCDYDRACAVGEPPALLDVGTARALVLATPDNSAFVPRETGGLIVRWVGADDAATLVSAALAIPDEDFAELADDLVHDGGRLVMFDSARDGNGLDVDAVASIELPAGAYQVRRCEEWAGEVLGGDGCAHEVMVQVLSLRPR